LPGIAFIGASPHLARRCAEGQFQRRSSVMCHRLAQYGVPGARRQPAIEAFPAFAAVARAKHGRAASHTGAWPYRAAVHGHDPDGLVIFGVAGHWETNVSDLFRHVIADPLPSLFCWIVLPVESVNTA